MLQRLLPLGVLALASVAHAQYVTGYTVSSATFYSPYLNASDSQTFNSNNASVWNTLTTRTSAVTLGAANSSGAVAGQMGLLKAKSFTSFPANGKSDYSESHANVAVLDYLTVSSETLAVGTVVAVTYQMGISGSFSVPVFQIGGVYRASASAGINGNSSLGSIYKTYANTGGQAPFTLVGTMNAKVGETISIQYYLDTLTYIAGTATVANTANVDFFSTAEITAWVDNPAVSLVAQSGHDYSTVPVPEPATALVLLLGIAKLRRRPKA